MRIKNNALARSLIERCEPFHGNNIFSITERPAQGVCLTTRYVVYSWGYHWPLVICEFDRDGNKVWYYNCEKYSQSTSRHLSLCLPFNVDAIPLETAAMKVVRDKGSVGLALMGEVA